MPVGKSSFSLFAFPFKFEADNFDQYVKALSDAECGSSEKRHRVWIKDKFPDKELLPHVASYLNAAAPRKSTAAMLRMDPNVLTSKAGLGVNSPWILELPGEHEDVAFLLDGIQLTLSRFGIGFLTFRVRPTSQELSSWLDFFHYFRFFGPGRGRRIQGQRRTGPGTVEPFFPEAACAATPDKEAQQQASGEGRFDKIIEAVLATGETTESGGHWWKAAYVPGQFIPFVSLYVDEYAEEPTDELIHRVRNFFHAEQEMCPCDDDLRFDHPGLLPYAQRQWFVLSRDGCAFLAIDAPKTPFFREAMPDHLGKHYFLIFELVLHQYFALAELSANVAEHWLGGAETDLAGFEKRRRQAFEKNLGALLDFNARGLFSQVCHREHHHRFYAKLQQFYTIDRLHDEVRDEIREMHDSLMMQRTEAVQQRLRTLELLALFIGVPGLVLSFLGINILDITAKDEGLNWSTAVGLGFGVGAILSLAAFLLLFRWGDKFDSLFSREK